MLSCEIDRIFLVRTLLLESFHSFFAVSAIRLPGRVEGRGGGGGQMLVVLPTAANDPHVSGARQAPAWMIAFVMTLALFNGSSCCGTSLGASAGAVGRSRFLASPFFDPRILKTLASNARKSRVRNPSKATTSRKSSEIRDWNCRTKLPQLFWYQHMLDPDDVPTWPKRGAPRHSRLKLRWLQRRKREREREREREKEMKRRKRGKRGKREKTHRETEKHKMQQCESRHHCCVSGNNVQC